MRSRMAKPVRGANADLLRSALRPFNLRPMPTLRFVSTVLLAAFAGVIAAANPAAAPVEQLLRIDRSKSYIDVDVSATLDSFTGRLERYDARIPVDANGRIRTATFGFKFADLKTGKPDRDARMLEWLGGGDPQGQFSLGVLALAPDGQGQANGRLTFNGRTDRVEFPVVVRRVDDTYTITGAVTVDYRNWGLKVLRYMMVRKVSPEVKIRFQLVGTLPPPPATEE